MKKLIIASIFLSCAIVPQAQVPSLQEGIKHLENENYSAALTTFTAIAKNDPKNGTIYYYIGEVSYLTEEYAEAEKSYKKGLNINPQCAECKVGLGKLMLDQGKPAEAEEYFGSASRLDKKNAEIFAMIGEAYLYNKKPNGKKAVVNLTTARDMNPKVARYWAHLGDAYKMIGNNGEAMTSYERAVEKDPANTSAYISMARIWAAANQNETAIDLLKKAIELSPDDAQPYKDLIEIYIEEGRYDEVTPLLEKYLSLIGTDIDAKVRFVKFLTFQAKDYDRAILEGEKLLKTNPEQYTLHRWLAWAYCEKGEYQHSYDHSMMLFEDIVKKEGRASFPSDYDYYAKAAFKLHLVEVDSTTKVKLLEEAAHIYRKYLELDPSRTQEIYGMLAKAYLDAKNYEQSVKYYLLKGSEKTLSGVDEYYLGIAYYWLDKYAEADSSFAKVLAITPDFPNGWLMRAKIARSIEIEDTTGVTRFLAKPYYENYVMYALKDKEKYKANLITAADYLAYYWTQIEDDTLAKSEIELQLDTVFTKETWNTYRVTKAIEYYDLVLELDPANSLAAENHKILTENLKIIKNQK